MQHLRPDRRRPETVQHLRDVAIGLDAWIVIDSTRLGPAIGGIRTRSVEGEAEALHEAEGLSWAMSVKCALAGLDAGGAKVLVRAVPGMDRRRVFARLGDAIQALEGRYVAGADFGTGPDDLAVLAEHTEHVHVDEETLTGALAIAHHRCVEGAFRVLGGMETRFHVAIQGVGSVGGAIARRLLGEGAHLRIADVDSAALEPFRGRAGVTVVKPEAILSTGADVLAPCALGGVISEAVAGTIDARVCAPGANNVFTDALAERTLTARGVLCVPDVIASAGAVVQGIGPDLMGWTDIEPHLEALGTLTEEVLLESRSSGAVPGRVARDRALARIEDPT